MINQQAQAEIFAAKHAAEIQVATAVVLECVRLFLNGTARGIIDPKKRSAAMAAVEHCNIVSLMLCLRPEAAKFVEANQSDAYWALIDAMNCLMDATGTHWPYITMERRSTYLSWAIPTAQQVH